MTTTIGNTSLPKEHGSAYSGKNAGRGVTRRDFLKGTGVLIVSCGIGGISVILDTAAASEGGSFIVDPNKLGSWLTIATDNTVTLFFGKVDNGQGVSTAFRQVVADELDVSIDSIKVVVGDTTLTVDQGGASGSSGLEDGSPPVRAACAEARLVLLEMASKYLGAPVEQLEVRDAIVSVRGNYAKKVSYGELISGQQLNANLKWNKKLGTDLNVTGRAKIKSPDQFRMIGKPVPRSDIPSIVFAKDHYVSDLRLPGMVHARSVRPPVAAAKPLSIDESSIGKIPGVVKVVVKGNYVAVVCNREEHAVKAARQLKVTWSEPSGSSFPTDSEGVHDYIRKAPSRFDKVDLNVGNVDEALKGAVRVIEATYEMPFQSHASFGPGCAVAEWRNGAVTVWSGTQKPYDLHNGIAAFFGIPQHKVRVIWRPGPGSYGRNDAGDVAFEAAFLAKEVGRPVRLQWMRHEGIAWDPKAPAAVTRLRGGFDAAGKVIAYDWDNKSFDHRDVYSRENSPGDTLVGQLLGFKRAKLYNRIGVPEDSYDFPNKRHKIHAVAPLLDMGSPLRTSHMRHPTASVVTFAHESFIDELALAAGADPVQFRLQYLTVPRQVALLKAAAKAAGWETRPSPKPGARAKGPGIVTGRGVAIRRGGATIAEVEVALETGKVRVTRLVCAHNCGLIVNPNGLENVIEGGLHYSMSRALHEEVKFNRSTVTSEDWSTYPIVTITDSPKIEKVMINEPENPPRGAGEETASQTQPAIANAIFDATGVRIRRIPFTAERVKAALAKA